jgi:DNA-binding MarR family transcriptional regulator
MDSLFDFLKHNKVNAKKEDPITSKAWAKNYSHSKKLKGNKLFALKMIYFHPGKSAKELEIIANLTAKTDGPIRKVAKLLEDDGLIVRQLNECDKALRLYINEKYRDLIKCWIE